MCSIWKMLRISVPHPPGDRFSGQLVAILRFILAPVYMFMVCVCALFKFYLSPCLGSAGSTFPRQCFNNDQHQLISCLSSAPVFLHWPPGLSPQGPLPGPLAGSRQSASRPRGWGNKLPRKPLHPGATFCSDNWLRPPPGLGIDILHCRA